MPTPSHLRPVTTAALSALALLVTVAGTSGSSSATSTSRDASAAVAVRQQATISMLPAISQPGARTASAKKAKLVISALFKPVKKGRRAVLLRKSGASWKPAGTTKTTTAGFAEFSVPTTKAVYKVAAAAYRGLPAISTTAVKSTTWGRAYFRDEFGGTVLSSAWRHRHPFYNPSGLRNCAKGAPEAAIVTRGTLRLSVLADPARPELCTAYRRDGTTIGQFRYRLNGHISTDGQRNFKYGVAAARMKFAKARGQHASFWLQPTIYKPAATTAAKGGAEIDIIEWFGDGGRQSGLTSFIYHPSTKGPVKVGGFLKQPDRFLDSKKDSWWTRYHVFSVEWTPKAYVFRIDGRETTRITEGISKVAQYPILSLLSSDYELENLGGESRLPQHTFVDWVQIWKAR